MPYRDVLGNGIHAEGLSLLFLWHLLDVCDLLFEQGLDPAYRKNG